MKWRNKKAAAVKATASFFIVFWLSEHNQPQNQAKSNMDFRLFA
jgi:hypothetical protein